MGTLRNSLDGRFDNWPPGGLLVRLYCCGFTPREPLHLGNARPMIVADLICSLLRSESESDVLFVMPVDDLDPRIGTGPMSVESQVRRAASDLRLVGAEQTAEMPLFSRLRIEMMNAVLPLTASGTAVSEGRNLVLRLGGQVEQQQIFDSLDPTGSVWRSICSHGRAVGNEKLILWRDWPVHEQAVDASSGRPSGELACHVAEKVYCGDPVDIHVGSVDLYRHHEAGVRIGAARGVRGVARAWVHTGAVLIGGTRMSNGAGNAIRLRDACDRWSADALRWMYLGTHYAEDLDASADSLAAAAEEAETARTHILESLSALTSAHGQKGSLAKRTYEVAGAVRHSLLEDLDTPRALQALGSLGTTLSPGPAGDHGVAPADASRALQYVCRLLGFGHWLKVS